MAVRKSLSALTRLLRRFLAWIISLLTSKKKAAKEIARPASPGVSLINLPPDEELYKIPDSIRRPTLPLAGQNYTLDTNRRSAGDLNVREVSLTEEEIAYARNRIRKIAQRLVSTMSRNRRHSSKKLQIDFRRSMRGAIETGGVIMDLKYKTRVIKKPRLAIILDTSGSMQIWLKMLIQIIQAIGLELSKKEIFIFSYDLECVTDDIGKTWQDTVDSLKLRSTWGGTTSIFTGLATFQREHHDKFSPQTVVLMLSDLYTDEPVKSAEEVRKIRRKTKSFYIFHVAEKELEMEEYNTYEETYIAPFRGAASAMYTITDLDSMANAVRNVCVRDR